MHKVVASRFFLFCYLPPMLADLESARVRLSRRYAVVSLVVILLDLNRAALAFFY